LEQFFIFQHQFSVRNINFPVGKRKQSIYNHCRIYLISSLKIHCRCCKFIYFCCNAFAGNHQCQVISNLINIITDIIKYLIIRSGTGPVVRQLVKAESHYYRPWIIQAFSSHCEIPIIPFLQSLPWYVRILAWLTVFFI